MTIDRKQAVLLDDNEITNYCNKDILDEVNRFNEVGVFNNAKVLLSELKAKINNEEAIPGYFFVDIKMPEMDGFEFLDQLEGLLGESNTVPIVMMLTTSTHKKDRIRFEASKLAQGYIVKPLHVSDLPE